MGCIVHRAPGNQFAETGFVVLRGLLTPGEIAFYTDRLDALAGDKRPWTQPDGVNRNSDFWPLLFNERLLSTVRGVLGADIRYLPHNDLHVGFSSFSWHRDNVGRNAGVGPDWDERTEPYRLVRVGIYLQKFAASQFKLGLVPGSHRLTRDGRPHSYRGMSTAARVLFGLTGVPLVGREAEWVATEPGDCVIFDPRILHTGTKSHGPKYSVFVAYGVENSHFQHHWQYYVHMRRDLGYADVNPELAVQLSAAGLLASRVPDDVTVPDAWMPSAAYNYVARRFK